MKSFHLDVSLIIPVVLIMLAGLFTMSGFSSQGGYLERQALWIFISLFVFLILSRIDFRFLKQTKVVLLLYVFLLIVLSSLFILGTITKGAQSWFSFGGLSFQPADAMKLVLIIVLAKYFSRRHNEIANIRHILVSFVYTLIPFFLVVLQPDFGSAMVILSIWFGMVLISGISKKHLFIVIGSAVFVFVFAWLLLFKPYQKERIVTFIDPLHDIQGSGYNAYQSTIAVGSGGVLGKGIGYGTQSRLEYLPEYRTDFIFAAYAEEWGFIGTSLLLLMFFFIFYKLISYANVAFSNFEALFTYGVCIWFFVHVLVSVGMNIGVMPVTGIPLPFMSYGGSHLLLEAVALAICVAMYRYGRKIRSGLSKNEFFGLE